MTIPIDDLEIGRIYRLQARNLTFAVWNGTDFVGIRDKFGERFLDSCEIPDRTAWALDEVGVVPEGVLLKPYLPTIDSVTERYVAFDKPVDSGGRGWYFLDDETESKEIRPFAPRNEALFAILDAFE
jgi:hypothetical protein